ncbi:MAG: DNA repair protein RadA [Actinomycetota bacterium]
MAAPKARSVHACGECGHRSPRWLGRCPDCGAWGTLVEEATAPISRGGAAPVPVRLADVGTGELSRIPTGVPELDRVLGGGLVPGALVLLGGEPGIGKSTLVLQALAHMAASRRVLLVTGEESPAQVAGRAERLAAAGHATGAVEVLAETGLERVVAALETHAPAVCAVDSVQTLASERLDSAPGSVAQVRQATADLMRVAKERGVAIILVGQVTKDGAIAGPRLLEHLVDCVLSFEGDPVSAHRVLRAGKNRFGSTNETGVFEMAAQGLVSVEDPTSLWLGDGAARVGSCVFPAVEGSRAPLVEVQALVGPTEIVPPRRVAGGVDRTRLAQVLAVLGRHAGLRLGDQDVFVSVAGGARAPDPAADLAIALAVASAHRGVPLPAGTAAFGEIGLTGALREVGHAARRLAAASAGGMAMAVVPPGAAGDAGAATVSAVGAADVKAALQACFSR